MTSRNNAFQEDARYRILRLLEDNADLSQREISDQLGISLGGVNYCLRKLVEQGSVKVRNFRTSRNKMNYVYLLTPKGLSEKSALTVRFLKRRMAEYEALKSEIEALEEELSLGGEASVPPDLRRRRKRQEYP